MKVNCHKKDLVDALNIVQKAVASKSTITILEGIYLEAKGQTLTLRGSNIDVSMETIFVTEVFEEGAIVVDSKMFGDIIRKLPNNIITIETQDENKVVNISSEKSRLDLLFQNAVDFPEFPKIDEGQSIDISQNKLKEMLKKVVFSVSQDDSRIILTGVLFDIKDNTINLVALDSFRMAFAMDNIDSNLMISKVVSSKLIRDLIGILADDENNIKITFTDNQAQFSFNNTRIMTRLLQGEFLKYEGMFPDFSKLTVTSDRNDLLSASERASLLASEGSTNLIKFDFEDSNLIISSNSKIGKIREEIESEIEGEGIEIAFNSRYILDILKNIDEERVIMEMNSPLSPCIFKPLDNDKLKYLILPVRISTR